MMSSIFTLWTGVALAFGPTGPVTGLSISPTAQRTQVLIAVGGDVEYRDFTMEGPNRLVVDLFGARHALPKDNFLGIHRGGVQSVRTSQFSSDVVRVVLELDALVPYDVDVVDGSLRVMLASQAGPFQPWTSGSLEGTAAPPRRPATPPARATRAAPSTAPAQDASRISVTFTNTPIEEVLFTFGEFSGRSIVAGSNVTGTISAIIDNQPWDEALRAILETNGFVATELESGIIRVDNVENLSQREAVEPVRTQAYRVNFATASELQQAVQGLTSDRGTVTTGQGTNTIIVNDIDRVHREIQSLISQLDVRTPQVTIQAKIIFVNRTDLEEFGVTYDLKDSAGNQINVVTPGAADADGDGVIELPDEQVEQGTNVISLGGNSVAALGNANNRVVGPTLTLLSSLLIGRHTLISFVEALESSNLSDVQAAPLVRVLDNQTARIVVGEDTPLRVIDAAGGGGGGGGGGGAGSLPVANVQIQETGIILQATPHVTANDDILLELEAERSAAVLAESDAGFIFQKQNATTRVLVRDGQTVVIGGLTVTEKSEVRSGIPLLMDLPVIGGLFRVTRLQDIQRDLIILVTPHIVREMD